MLHQFEERYGGAWKIDHGHYRAGVIVGGPLGGLVIVAPLIVAFVAKKVLNYVFLNRHLEELRRQIDLVKAAAGSYFKGYNDALRELQDCKKKAADTEAATTPLPFKTSSTSCYRPTMIV